MPNHCYNRVTFYSDDKEKEIKKLHDIFSIDVESVDEERTIFGQFIPEYGSAVSSPSAASSPQTLMLPRVKKRL